MASSYERPREYVQKTVFTKWMNEVLQNTGTQVRDIGKDLDDGLVLIKLLEVLTNGKKMPGR